MARRKMVVAFANCPRCGATTHMPNARFCGHCGASLAGGASSLPTWQRSTPAKYNHVAMNRIALSCPECGEPMRFGFRKICRRCGARLVMVPRLFHPNHVRVYTAGLRAALAGLAVEVFWFAVLIGILGLIGLSMHSGK